MSDVAKVINLEELLLLGREELVMRWRLAFASSPPKNTSTLLLQKVLMHHLQSKLRGDITVRTRKVLREALKLASQKGAGASMPGMSSQPAMNGGLAFHPTSSTLALSPGIQLVREWKGQTWRVEVLEDGFSCNGKIYRSLSAIAKMITGAHWSGPRFFGLNQ